MTALTALRAPFAALPRDARDTLFLLAVVGWVLLPLTGHLPLWASALAYALLAWRGTLAWQGRALPNRWWLAVLLALCVFGTLATFRTIVGRDAGVTLIALLLALKTLELHGRRDAMVIFFLGFFTMLSNFFFSQSLATAAAMLLALLGLLTALVNAHLPVGRPPLAQSLRTAGTMALLGAPVMAALFIFFPRMAPLWGLPTDPNAARSGLSNEMRVGNMAELALDDAVALRVRFLSPDGQPPPQSQMYFRGPVLSEFDGREWSAIPGRSFRWQVPGRADLSVRGEPLRYEITLEANQRPWLLTLDAAPESPRLPEGLMAFQTPELQWVATRPVTSVMRYSATSYPDFVLGLREPESALAQFTVLPPGFDPRTRALAQDMRNDPRYAGGGTQALVNAALLRLRTGGYQYTLEPGVYGQHTADEFWFDSKAGFCEHIASAFVVLMRAMDVPARIVTGYQGGDLNSVDGYWAVRQSDAHAWSEVWMEGRGWVRVDPTGAVAPGRTGQFQRLRAPQSTFANAVDTVISPNVLQQMRAVWEAMNNHWNQWVLNYTQGRQLDLLRSLGIESPSWADLVRLLGILLGLAALGGAVWTLWERRRTDPWTRMLATVRQHLARAGLDLPAHLPPRALAAQARTHFGPEADALAAWLLQLEQSRYAPTPGPQHHLPALRRSLRQLPWPQARNASAPAIP